MASYPCTHVLRSTTPPLYYNRPDGTTLSYYTVPAREVEGLRIPPPGDAPRNVPPPPATTPAMSACPRASVGLRPSTDRSSTQRLPLPPPSPRLSGYAMPSVVNPYVVPATHAASEVMYAPAYAPPAGTTGAGNWGCPSLPQQQQSQQQQHQPYPTVDPLVSRVATFDAEESALAAEEATLRAKLAELQVTRRRQEDEQLHLSHGWAQMLEKEERYYTEPLVDRRPDIMAREQQCAMLHERLQQAEAQAQHAQAQLQATEYIVRDVETFEQERQRVQDGFQKIERRRRECVAKVERYFDVEAKRVVEGNKIVRKLDGQLREMTRRGPLAQLQGHNRSPSTRQSSSRAVTFAPEKSIVLDLGREESSDPATEEGSGGGLTNSYASTYTSQSANSPAMGLTKASEEGDIGGTSIAFSFNDTTESSLMKRRKTEVASV